MPTREITFDTLSWAPLKAPDGSNALEAFFTRSTKEGESFPRSWKSAKENVRAGDEKKGFDH